jgi:hypothetical protein
MRGKAHQLLSVVSLVSKRTLTLDLHVLNRRRGPFSVVRYSSRSNDGLENTSEKRPSPTVPSQSRLKDMIRKGELFSDASLTQQDIDGIIKAELATLNKYDLVQFLLKSVKFSKKNRRIEIVQRHLVGIQICLSRFPTSSWTGKDVALVMNSLQAVRNDDASVNDLLVLMKTIMNESLKVTGPQSLNSQGFAMIIYGLRRMNSDSGTICSLLSALVPKVDSCVEIFSAQAVGNALYGMQEQ